MKKRLNIITLLAVAIVALCGGCSKWTEIESLKIDSPSIDQLNPALYQEYLDNLRKYKMSNHPVMLGWFDNSNKSFVSRGMHLADVPDRVDIISLLYPDTLKDSEISEIAQLREKSTKVIYTIDCQQLYQNVVSQNLAIAEQNALGQEQAELEGTTFTPTPLIVYTEALSSFLDEQLALLAKYGYDGFSINYIGKSSAFLTDEAKTEMKTAQDLIVTKTKAVIEQNTGKLFIFEGTPEHLLDKDFLTLFDYIMLRNFSQKCITDFTQEALLVAVPGVPMDRLLVGTAPVFMDEAETVFGTILDPNGVAVNSVEETARWVVTPDARFYKAGMGVWHINADYYNANAPYGAVLSALNIMNPSAN